MNFSEKSVQQKRLDFSDDKLNKRGTLRFLHSITVLFLLLTLFFLIFGFTLGFVQALYRRTPDITTHEIATGGKSTVIYDEPGNKVATLSSKYYKPIPVSIEEVPQTLQDAVISSIDPDFYDHYGITVYNVINTTISSIMNRNIYGSSTLITEKLLEDTNPEFRTNCNWITRLEYHLEIYFKAISLERNCSKDEILEAFLNTASFGNGIIGVEAAAQYYYGKTVSDLNLSECVMLATIVTDPYQYDPYEHQEDATLQYMSTLAIMQDKAFITESQWTKGSKSKPFENLQTYSDATMLSAFGQAALDQLAKQFAEKYKINATKFHNMMVYGNLKIYTTQDTKLQKEAQRIVDDPANYTYSAQNSEVSLTLMDAKTGKMRAVIGGKNGKTANLNRATKMTRQPGTIFQTLATYVPGIDNDTLTLASVYEDSAYHYLDNHREVSSIDGVYDGLTTIREALSQPMNLVAARAQSDVTSQVSLDYLTNMGFEHIVESDVDSSGNMITDVQQSICNGALIKGVTNLEITDAMSALANEGNMCKPIFYTKVLNSDGSEILVNKPTATRVIRNSTAFLISNVLRENGSGISEHADVAKITGNNDEKNDFWCTGYTTDITATLWIGYDDNRNFESSYSAGKIWDKIMKYSINPDTDIRFVKPADVTVQNICQESGLLAVPGICDHDPRGNRIFTEYFTENTIPATTCNTHVEVTICPSSKRLINNNCPKENYITRVYLVLPDHSTDTLDQRYALPEQYKNGKRCHIHKKNW